MLDVCFISIAELYLADAIEPLAERRQGYDGDMTGSLSDDRTLQNPDQSLKRE